MSKIIKSSTHNETSIDTQFEPQKSLETPETTFSFHKIIYNPIIEISYIIFILLYSISFILNTFTDSINLELSIVELFLILLISTEIPLKLYFFKSFYFYDLWNSTEFILQLFSIFTTLIAVISESLAESDEYKIIGMIRTCRLLFLLRRTENLKNLKYLKIPSTLRSRSKKVLLILSKLLNFYWVQNEHILLNKLEWLEKKIKNHSIYEVKAEGAFAEWAGIQTAFSKNKINTKNLRGSIIMQDSHSEISHLLTEIDNYTFNIFELHRETEGEALVSICVYLFDRLSLFYTQNINKTVFHDYIFKIQQGYFSSNPYHNSIHAADVVQAFHYFLYPGEAKEKCRLSSTDLAICYISAAIHDFQHPGVNNLFLVNASDDLALVYNDISILENHHVASALQILNDPSVNWTSKMDFETTKYYKKKIISLVLATDFSKHFEAVSNFEDRFSSGVVKTPEEKLTVMEMMMHAADVSNPSRPWDLYHAWATLILEEFFAEGDKEKEMNLPVSQLCDRETVNIPKSQIGFIEVFIAPTFQSLILVLPKLSECLSNVETNKNKWKSKISGKIP